MTKDEMLNLATCFKIHEDITVEKRGKDTWCVSIFGSVLDKDLIRHHEPPPSWRTEEFIQNTRFTLTEAFALAKRYNEKNYETVE
jgi:hypothetical protein